MRRRPYEKYLDSSLRGWMVRTATKNHWRVASWMDLDDLIAEGFLAFAICKARYAHRVENKAHFMSLFKTVYFSQIMKLAKANLSTFSNESCFSDCFPEEAGVLPEHLLGAVDGEAELVASLAKANAPLASLVELLAKGANAAPQDSPHHRETNNEFWNRLLGTQGIDFQSEMTALLAG